MEPGGSFWNFLQALVPLRAPRCVETKSVGLDQTLMNSPQEKARILEYITEMRMSRHVLQVCHEVLRGNID